MTTPRVAAIHDMSGFGRCSLTVAIPILSAMGVQCCPLPTAFLSTHTGGFEGFTFLDMTDEMPKIAAHWARLGLEFQAIYSGFLGSERYLTDTFGVKLTPRTNVDTPAGSYATSVDRVFAAGDIRRGQSLVVWAIAEGEAAAHAIDESLMGYSNLAV